MQIKAIAAMTADRVIGKDNALPWNVPEDMKHFVKLTKGHSVLMGRKTFQSAPMNSRPLPKRKNIVVTRDPGGQPEIESVEYTTDPRRYIEECKAGARELPSDTLWIIGGQNLYEQTMDLLDELHITIIKLDVIGDAYFPPFEEQFELVSQEEIDPCIFQHYIRK
ncbi:MAG: dihydrofolate reductase [Bdellovibrionales bacterium]|nr:dihydrofolate reductase [Bdellovibrionales bacterium]